MTQHLIYGCAPFSLKGFLTTVKSSSLPSLLRRRLALVSFFPLSKCTHACMHSFKRLIRRPPEQHCIVLYCVAWSVISNITAHELLSCDAITFRTVRYGIRVWMVMHCIVLSWVVLCWNYLKTCNASHFLLCCAVLLWYVVLVRVTLYKTAHCNAH